MEESLSKFITAILAIVIMFIFPVYIAYEKKDDISYALAVRYTQDFVDKVRSKGYLTRELYQDYASNLLTTGNTYKIELEHRYVRFDSNSESAGSEVSAVRNEEIYSTEHILNFMDSNEEHKYVMNVGDNFSVKIKNTNVTMATIIYNIVTVNMTKNNVRIHVDYGGKILADKWWGKINFLPGGEDLDYRTIFSVVKAEAYTTFEGAKNGEGAIKDKSQVVLDTAEQNIYYKVSYAYKPERITGAVYDGNRFKENTTTPIYTDPNGKYEIYEVKYGDMDITTHAEFNVKYTTKYGETVDKKASSPTFRIATPKVTAYASLDDARKGVNEILEGENVVSLEGSKNIYYRLNVSKSSRALGVTADIYRNNVIISNNVEVKVEDDTNEDFIIYKVNYTNLPTNKSDRTIYNNYAVFSFTLDGESRLTRKTVKFNFVYHDISVKLGKITGDVVNVVGYKGSSEVRTTYKNNGYESKLQVKGSNGVYSYNTNGVVMEISTYTNEKNNGVVVNYTLTNETQEVKVVRLAIHTDVYVDGDDKAYLSKMDTYGNVVDSNGLVVKANNEYEIGKINIIRMKAKNGTIFYVTVNDFDNYNSASGKANNPKNSMWLGYYNDRKSHYWDSDNGHSTSGTDSGFAFSWQDIEIPAGSSVERSFSISLE